MLHSFLRMGPAVSADVATKIGAVDLAVKLGYPSTHLVGGPRPQPSHGHGHAAGGCSCSAAAGESPATTSFPAMPLTTGSTAQRASLLPPIPDDGIQRLMPTTPAATSCPPWLEAELLASAVVWRRHIPAVAGVGEAAAGDAPWIQAGSGDPSAPRSWSGAASPNQTPA